MTRKSLQLLAALPLLLAAIFTLSSFTKSADKDVVNGGGYTADGSYFDFTVVENKKSVSGHFTWEGTTYGVTCVAVVGNAATIYLDNGQIVYIVDGGANNADADQISAPFTGTIGSCGFESTTSLYDVSGGNLTVHK